MNALNIDDFLIEIVNQRLMGQYRPNRPPQYRHLLDAQQLAGVIVDHLDFTHLVIDQKPLKWAI